MLAEEKAKKHVLECLKNNLLLRRQISFYRCYIVLIESMLLTSFEEAFNRVSSISPL